MLSTRDLSAILTLINRAPITGDEAEGVATIKYKVRQMLLPQDSAQAKEDKTDGDSQDSAE